MSNRSSPRQQSPDTGVSVGLLMAASMIPRTFQRSLSQRSAVDQGIVTGLSTGVHYLLTVATQDALQAVATELAQATSIRRSDDPVARQRALTLLADLGAIPVGLAVRRAFPRRPAEPMRRGLLRQLGWRFAVTGVGGAVLLVTQAGMRALDRRWGARGRIASFPVAVPVGLGIAYVLDRRRLTTDNEETPFGPGDKPSGLRSLAAAGGVVGALAGLAYGEHATATAAGRALASALPGGPQVWKLVGHGATLALLAGAGYAVHGRAIRRIEAGTSALRPILQSDEASRWTGPTVSGGPGSLVPWATLGREGRRHALAHVRAQTLVDRPRGAPDLSIETVMGEPATATPVQVYVGLDSAASVTERVDLALAEMDRTGAFDRSLIMLSHRPAPATSTTSPSPRHSTWLAAT